MKNELGKRKDVPFWFFFLLKNKTKVRPAIRTPADDAEIATIFVLFALDFASFVVLSF